MEQNVKLGLSLLYKNIFNMKLINNVLFYYYNLEFLKNVYFLQTKVTTSDLNCFILILYTNIVM